MKVDRGFIMVRNSLIMGSPGRDFHNFNTFFKGNSCYSVVAFNATQISDPPPRGEMDEKFYTLELADEGSS